ncbi:UDP-N-acetylglucosamine 2-epimerase [Brevibacillus borstelensis]|uniref:UDP-N-acetylglucosamine 2-epimerase n=1 Tax=Brevibacillus borstelensis TaxID=45462 RepID=UPI002E23C164|nr:UDP-N-acetylglucosamine 2-epimerase [Brevibacillus borstelensis]MED1745801.1 UDP-N-acetylglucosamine 2-epimerase [Brevibacillus borstelensis]MED2007468.1 UDP-N-acetylglucosamine 2-epimerase [Brevibacillus borstelensis]
MNKKIMFLTGTRADFGKLKSLIRAVDDSPLFECSIFVTGMHTLSRYGYTVEEVYKEGYKNIHTFMNQIHGEPMDLVLANTIGGLSRFIHEDKPDLIVVHGDRIEALAGAIVGSLNNILVAHIEGGELSGTIDESIRHSVSKLSHLHFVANKEAATRLEQLGEKTENIYIIGSPDIDIMLSDKLPSLSDAQKRYNIHFENFGIVLYHPVTTEIEHMREYANNLVRALIDSGHNYVVIYPNNDLGSNDILAEYKKLENNHRFRIFPSLRFEYFLTLLKNAQFIIGNSSAGIHEAPVFGLPTINIGTRQRNRFFHNSIYHISNDYSEIIQATRNVLKTVRREPCFSFGFGNSTELFMKVLEEGAIWQTSKQKHFQELIPR